MGGDWLWARLCVGVFLQLCYPNAPKAPQSSRYLRQPLLPHLAPPREQAGVSFWAAWCIPGVAVFAMTLFFAKLVRSCVHCRLLLGAAASSCLRPGTAAGCWVLPRPHR